MAKFVPGKKPIKTADKDDSNEKRNGRQLAETQDDQDGKFSWPIEMQQMPEKSMQNIKQEVIGMVEHSQDVKDRERGNHFQKEKESFLKEIDVLKESLSSKEREINSLIKDKVYLQSKLKQEKTENETLSKRLSRIAGEKLLGLGDRPCIDLADINRPTKLAERFSELYDNECTGAYYQVERHEKMGDEEIIALLLDILLSCDTFCRSVSKKQKEDLLKTLTLSRTKTDGITAFERELVSDTQKKFAEQCIKYVTEMYWASDRSKEFPFLENPSKSHDVKTYTEQCLDLCWRMSVHDPPVVLGDCSKYVGGNFNKDIFKYYTQSGCFIAYIIWPPLFLSEGGALLQKGVAQGTKQDTKSKRTK